jgi:hypothetical protein
METCCALYCFAFHPLRRHDPLAPLTHCDSHWRTVECAHSGDAPAHTLSHPAFCPSVRSSCAVYASVCCAVFPAPWPFNGQVATGSPMARSLCGGGSADTAEANCACCHTLLRCLPFVFADSSIPATPSALSLVCPAAAATAAAAKGLARTEARSATTRDTRGNKERGVSGTRCIFHAAYCASPRGALLLLRSVDSSCSLAAPRRQRGGEQHRIELVQLLDQRKLAHAPSVAPL